VKFGLSVLQMAVSHAENPIEAPASLNPAT